MERRQFFSRVAGIAVVGLAARPARPGAQEAGADRLRMPGAVQQRAVVTDAQNDPVVIGIERRLKCTCGCNLDIFICRTTDFSCTFSPGLHRELVALLEAGNTPDEVVAAFVAKYGEATLMAPKPEGFNLTGYFVPGLALLTAGGILAAVLLRRHRLAESNVPPVADRHAATLPLEARASDAELARLEQALEEVER